LSDNELGGVDDGKALGIVTALEIKRRKIGYSAHRAMVEPSDCQILPYCRNCASTRVLHGIGSFPSTLLLDQSASRGPKATM
jgi:hypothetical protein